MSNPNTYDRLGTLYDSLTELMEDIDDIEESPVINTIELKRTLETIIQRMMQARDYTEEVMCEIRPHFLLPDGEGTTDKPDSEIFT